MIAGAGPAGASLAGLLAHRGIEVTLLERRRDFAREFRGEVLMPGGIQALEQMGVGSMLQTIPNHTQRAISLYMNGRRFLKEKLEEEAFDGRLPLAVSQPALLEALVEHAQRSPPMDIVWCKIPCPADWDGAAGYAGRGHLLFAYRTWDESLQLGWVILKGTFGELRNRGIEQWIEEMAHHVDPNLAAHLRANAGAAQRPFLLDSVADCVTRWSTPGTLVIGDAAHTMSPVGGQGVNIALRDAIVAANHLVPAMTGANQTETRLQNALRAIEDERMPEVRRIQALQAQPPRIMLNRAWWGEPLRRLAAAVLSHEKIRRRAATRVSAFPFGVTEVRLTV